MVHLQTGTTRKKSMLKTTAEKPARFGMFSRGLIVCAILGEYVYHPLRFLVGTALTLNSFKKRLPKDIPKDFGDMYAFPTWIYIRLKKKLGQEKAFALARTIILPLGMAVYGAEFCPVEAPRTWVNFMRFLEHSLKKGAIQWSKVEIEEKSETIHKYRCTFCMIYDFLSKVDVPELTECFCTLDNAVYNAYLPNEMTFERGGTRNTMEKGNSYCQFIHELKFYESLPDQVR
jgi:hypothetical protein